ncbi:MAG TPA: hypothetical protein VK435_11235 [Thermodesulfovibrionales bacterium]|nr:hypothetical protein [Thermodesulfovibrionales bacterium]
MKIRLTPRIFLFLSAFSLVFWLIRTADHGKMLLVDLQDLGGIPWLYSAICLIFSILAAFTIQKEWEHWDDLVTAIKGELDTIRELWKWSQHLAGGSRDDISNCLENYLTALLADWPETRRADGRSAGENVLDVLRRTIVELPSGTGRTQQLALFEELIRNRDKRTDQSISHIPQVLKNTLIFTDILVIVLSLFIGVRNPFIDYLFTVSIAALSYTIYIVIDDLDNPFRPGSWHLTSFEHHLLLDKIRLGRDTKAFD